MFSKNDEVTTPYGAGFIQDVRTDCFIVLLHNWVRVCPHIFTCRMC